jgi:hypothetical protein
MGYSRVIGKIDTLKLAANSIEVNGSSFESPDTDNEAFIFSLSIEKGDNANSHITPYESESSGKHDRYKGSLYLNEPEFCTLRKQLTEEGKAFDFECLFEAPAKDSDYFGLQRRLVSFIELK